MEIRRGRPLQKEPPWYYAFRQRHERKSVCSDGDGGGRASTQALKTVGAFKEHVMATVIRSPRLYKKPRKLHSAEAVESKEVESKTVEPKAQPVPQMQIKDPPERYAVPAERIVHA